VKICIKTKTRHAFGGWPGSDGIANKRAGVVRTDALIASIDIITAFSYSFNSKGNLA